MRGDELAVEQLPPARAQARDEVRERNLGRIARPADHRFAEKGAAERDAVEAADQFAILPALDAMRVADLEQPIVTRLDHRIDPRRGSVARGLGTQRNHVGKGAIGGDAKTIGDDRLFQAMRQPESIQWQDRAQPRLNPMDRRVIRPVGHRENTLRISTEQQRRVDGLKILQEAGFTNFSVIRSDSPIATYLARSVSPSRSAGGRVQTPFS